MDESLGHELVYYCKNGNIEQARELLKNTRVDPCFDNRLLKSASFRGDVDMMRLLVEYVDPSVEDNYAFHLAFMYGHVEIVRLLLTDSRVNPALQDNLAIQWSARFGECEVVRLLLQDPRVDASRAESDNPEIKEMLAQWKYHPR